MMPGPFGCLRDPLGTPSGACVGKEDPQRGCSEPAVPGRCPGGGFYTVKIHAAITGGHAALSARGHRCWGAARLLAEG